MTTAEAVLRTWQLRRLEWSRKEPLPPPGPSGVTIVAYHFWPSDHADAEFAFLECSIRETWRHCGRLPVSLVVDAPCPAIIAFARLYEGLVRIHVSDVLRPGSVPSMSIDCNANLAKWFATEHCLIVQNDGFPVRPGLEGFMGRFDYLGAPFVRRNWKTRLAGIWPRHAGGNGGFSLRSHRVCEAANLRWPRFSKGRPDRWLAREDVFYSLALPILSRSYRKAFSIAPLDEALRFSYDALYDAPPDACPFGLHGAEAFSLFRARGWISDP